MNVPPQEVSRPVLPDRRAWIVDRQLQPQEEVLLDLFAQHESLVFFDAGACEGESSVRYARLFPGSTVYAVEPLPGNVTLLHQTLGTYGVTNVVPLQTCLAHRAGPMTFHLSAGAPAEFAGLELDYDFGNKSSSLLAPQETATAYPWLEFPETVTVATERLDALAARLGLRCIDFFHLDVQGAELLVLRGAGEFLPHIHTVWLEVEDVPLYAGQPLRRDVSCFMRRRGFVKLLETWGDETGEPYGDQFWAQRTWLVARKGRLWTGRAVMKELRRARVRSRSTTG